MRGVTGLPGCFEPSPIDTDRFAPRAAGTHEGTEFAVGRLSRDDPLKFHPEAASFFKALASQGCTVKLMGATPLRPALELGDVPAEATNGRKRPLTVAY